MRYLPPKVAYDEFESLNTISFGLYLPLQSKSKLKWSHLTFLSFSCNLLHFRPKISWGNSCTKKPHFQHVPNLLEYSHHRPSKYIVVCLDIITYLIWVEFLQDSLKILQKFKKVKKTQVQRNIITFICSVFFLYKSKKIWEYIYKICLYVHEIHLGCLDSSVWFVWSIYLLLYHFIFMY